MTFKEYLATRRVTDTPAGDFTVDALGDHRLPDVETWPELRSYLESHAELGARDEVRAAARQVWSGYQRALAKR